MVRTLKDQLAIYEDPENSCSMVVMTAVPGKAFCAGGDVRCSLLFLNARILGCF